MTKDREMNTLSNVVIQEKDVDAALIKALEEASKYFTQMTEKQPGDLTIKDVMKYFHCSDSHARRRMNKAVEDGKFEKVKVIDPETNRVVLVYRPVASNKKGNG